MINKTPRCRDSKSIIIPGKKGAFGIPTDFFYFDASFLWGCCTISIFYNAYKLHPFAPREMPPLSRVSAPSRAGSWPSRWLGCTRPRSDWPRRRVTSGGNGIFDRNRDGEEKGFPKKIPKKTSASKARKRLILGRQLCFL